MVQRSDAAVEVAPTAALSPSFLRDLRAMLDAAFSGVPFEDGFTDDDWNHALGGIHVWLTADTLLISHASLVERTFVCSGQPVRVGYVEAVATIAARRGEGHAAAVMRRVGELIQQQYPLGALSTGAPAFYERLGWERWRGPTFVSGPDGLVRTPEDDGGIMILRTSRSPDLDLDRAIVCDWRRGDAW